MLTDAKIEKKRKNNLKQNLAFVRYPNMENMNIQIEGKIPLIRNTCGSKCKGCMKGTIYQKNCRGLSNVVRVFEDYHWICRVCVKCNRGAIVTENNRFIYVNINGIHKPELGGCNPRAREFTKEEINQQFYYVLNYGDLEMLNIYE